MSDLIVETSNKALADRSVSVGGHVLMFTPPIDKDYWLLRVKLSDKNAVVAFPKFGTVGIGFQHEEDWNTNLPYTSDAEAIYDHIAHNAGDDTITKERAVAAIRLLQERIKELRS